MRRFFPTLLLLALLLPVAAHAQSSDFVPLTSLPGLKDFVGATSLPNLLSSIYKICIGLAATLAVLQIMLAGVEYMGGDSVTEKKAARERIGLAIGGLILVLSPTIVFSIINPHILDLDISNDVGQLAPGTSSTGSASAAPASSDSLTSTPSGAPSCAAPIANGATVASANDQACCNAQQGCHVQISFTNALNAPTCACTQ